jgi:DUF1680 family protein
MHKRPGLPPDHAPVREQTTAVGHAVRASYLYSAMTDIATMVGDGLAAVVARCSTM